MPIIEWLSVMHRLNPPDRIIYIGVGEAMGEWIDWLININPAQVLLVEANARKYARIIERQSQFVLQNRIPAHWKVINAVVTPNGEALPYHSVTLESESGIIAPGNLKAYWPNISEKAGNQAEAPSCISIAQLIESDTEYSKILPQLPKAWLIIDTLAAQSIVAKELQILAEMQLIVARVGLIDADTGVSSEVLVGQLQDLSDTLSEHGYELSTKQKTRHPRIAHGLWIKPFEYILRNHQQSLQSVYNQQRQQDAQHIRDISDEKASLEQSLLDLQNKLGDKELLNQKFQMTLEKCELDLSEMQKKLIQTKEVARLDIEQTHTVVKEQIESTIKQLLNATPTRGQVVDTIIKTIKSSAENSNKQIASYMAIQNYLNTGALPLGDYHGWPISPDLGKFLIEQIHVNHYDYIVEFGSGTSTALLARIIKNMLERVDNSNSDNKKRIITFEHNEIYYHKTQQLLELSGLTDYVELNLTPLTDWSDETGVYRYYDCSESLVRLSTQIGEQNAKILLFVDGPPGSTCANARYPAVPMAYKYLHMHQIDVVLDDTIRVDERNAIELWQRYWKINLFNYEELRLNTEKGIYFAKTYKD